MKKNNKIFQADLAAFKLLGYVLVFIWGMLCFLPFFSPNPFASHLWKTAGSSHLSGQTPCVHRRF